MHALKIALLIDDGALACFERAALLTVADGATIEVFSCTNTRHRRRPFRHGLYYLLNAFSIRNRWSRPVPLEGSDLPIAGRVDFEAEEEGSWQSLPAAVLARLRAAAPDVILKFGMGLLRVPDGIGAPILSYHHGDPDKYRGRPAGFYELLNGEAVMGQIVQKLGNRLDAGEVLAFGETRVFAHSYRATMVEAYRHSPFLLRQAVRNALAGEAIPKPSSGRNYRLPSNLLVARFLLRMARAAARRLLYGAFVEKRWDVALAPAPAGDALPVSEMFPAEQEWKRIEKRPGYTFYADPHFAADPSTLLVEAMNRRSGKGEILRVGADGGQRPLSDPRHHFSYPASVFEADAFYLVPEIAEWSTPRIYRVEEEGLAEVGPLRVAGAPRLVDPTLVRHEGRLYLFANDLAEGSSVLSLWSAPSLFDEFERHPASPIRVSPLGARMAGPIRRIGGALIRPGQDFGLAYGDGLLFFEIERLDRLCYAERPAGALRFASRRGPHTLDRAGGRLAFDYYEERFSLLAGLRRAKGRFL
jgi:hypothetical protein